MEKKPDAKAEWVDVNFADLVEFIFEELVRDGYAPEEAVISKIILLQSKFIEERMGISLESDDYDDNGVH